MDGFWIILAIIGAICCGVSSAYLFKEDKTFFGTVMLFFLGINLFNLVCNSIDYGKEQAKREVAEKQVVVKGKITSSEEDSLTWFVVSCEELRVEKSLVTKQTQMGDTLIMKGNEIIKNISLENRIDQQ